LVRRWVLQPINRNCADSLSAALCHSMGHVSLKLCSCRIMPMARRHSLPLLSRSSSQLCAQCSLVLLRLGVV
jgi:hypothetical protein